MEKDTTYVGLDVHKSSIAVSVLLPQQDKPMEWTDPNTDRVVRRLLRKLKRLAPSGVQACYEAGPCGYVVQRQLEAVGVSCQVVAPSLMPTKPGERVKTDRRDARKLGEMLRAGLLTEVRPPTPEEESVRDLCRCREDAKDDQLRARQRLGKFLLRRGLTWEGRNWTLAHHRWLRNLEFESRADQAVFASYMESLEQQSERVRALTVALEEAAKQEPYCEPVGWLRCFRGVDTVTALTLLAEIQDFRRFSSARHLMSYLGLTPSEHSSGESQRRGAITKAGNTHARRILIEAAWHYRHPPAVGVNLKKRRAGQPATIIALADRAQRHLWRRYFRMHSCQNKPPSKVVVAIARELAGFLWAAVVQPTSAKA